MLVYPHEKTMVFIDGSSFFGAAKSLQFDVDYDALLRFLSAKTTLMRALFYTVLREEPDGHIPLRTLVDYLEFHGYSVMTKKLKEYTDIDGQKKSKGNMDIEMAVDMINLTQAIDHVILCSGDAGFRYVVKTLQERGKRVSVCSTIATQPIMISDDLRRQADNFIELKDIMLKISRGPRKEIA